jgi:RsmE family RNA methyltransferase
VNLILLEPGEISRDGRARIGGDRARHLVSVLRAAPGHRIRAGLVDGPTGAAIVEACGEDAVDLRCTFDGPVPCRPAVDLLLALPRPKVLRRLWAQLAALGVGQIILTNAERVERHYFDTHVLAPECYRPLLVEGLQQARDTRLPAVSIHRRLRVLVEDDLDRLFPEGVRLTAHPDAARTITGALQNRGDRRVLLAVGPEGGWNGFELELLAAHGFEDVGIGPRTLRSDTACVALIAMVNEVLR